MKITIPIEKEKIETLLNLWDLCYRKKEGGIWLITEQGYEIEIIPSKKILKKGITQFIPLKNRGR